MKQIIVIDTETAGAIPTDCPIEIAMSTDTEALTYELRPEFPITPGASAIHGILQQEACTRENHDDVLTRFYNEQHRKFEDENNVTTGWNVEFDVDIINSAMARHELPTIKFANIVDMMPVAKRMFNVAAVGGYSLDAIYLALNPTRERLNKLQAMRAQHSAINDVSITRETFNDMVKLAIDSKGLKTGGIQIRDVEGFINYANTPTLLTEWPIGKFKGRKFEDVVRQDKRLVAWVKRQSWFEEPRWRDFRYTLEKHSKSDRRLL